MVRDLERLRFLLNTVEREGRHLLATTRRVLPEPVNAAWVRALEGNADLAERLDAFVARCRRVRRQGACYGSGG